MSDVYRFKTMGVSVMTDILSDGTKLYTPKNTIEAIGISLILTVNTFAASQNCSHKKLVGYISCDAFQIGYWNLIE